MEIDGKCIDELERPYLIAEIGVNYYDIADKENISLMEAAKKMVREASKAGVDAVKFQTYKAEKLASKNSPAYWDTDEESTTSQYELFKKFDKFDDEDFHEIAKYTIDECKISFLSTPFDFEAVDYLNDILPAFKIASADITNLPFLKHIAKKKKPVLLSTGASNLAEIYEAVSVFKKAGIEDEKISVLHCILEYPTKHENANLNMIGHLDKIFSNLTIGYSDHVPPDKCMITLINAYLKGAEIIEKHFTLDKTLPGNDHYHAMDPEDIKVFFKNIELLNKTNGSSFKEPLETEQDSRMFARRSIVASKAIKKGEEIKREKVSLKRPGTGISPKYLNKVLGKKAKNQLDEDEILQWEDI